MAKQKKIAEVPENKKVPAPVPKGEWGCRACGTVNPTTQTCPRGRNYISYRDYCSGCNEANFVVIDRDGTIYAVLLNPVV